MPSQRSTVSKKNNRWDNNKTVNRKQLLGVKTDEPDHKTKGTVGKKHVEVT